MPTFAESVSSGEITQVNVKVGQVVNEGDLIGVVDIEKSTVELFVQKSGKITDLKIKPGDSVKPGFEYLIIDDTVKPEKQTDKSIKKDEVKQNNQESVKVNTNQSQTESKTKSQETQSQPQTHNEPTKTKLESKEPKLIETKTLFSSNREERREKMSMLRRKVAQRLKDSQNTNALLTTFNEIDMGYLIDIRNKHQEEFTKT